jgi:SNF2 family DNA or RNA helicase
LGVSGTGDFQTFSSNYQNNQVGQRRLFAMLNSMMLRRTYGDKLMGEALVKLPRTSQATTWVTFNPIERKVYDLVHQRILENVTNMSRRGSLHKLTYHHVLTMILRLRQAASHLLLVEQSMRDLLTKSDMEELHQLVREQEHGIDQRNKNSILELRRLLKSNEEWKAATYEEPESFMADIEKNYDRKLTTNNTGALYGLSYNFQAYLKKLEDGSRIEEMRESMRCHMCNQDPAKDPYLTECSHIYCKTCITTIGFEAASQGFPARCRVCSRVYKSSAPFDPKKQQEPDGEASGSKNGKPKKSKPRKTSNKGDKDFLMNNPEITPLPSAKTIAIKAQILNWMEENPKVKIIVFTQFLPIISILTRMCDAEGWPSFGFCGDMSIEARDAAIKAFDANDQPCVMVATLKTGGVGLNLTMASKVIIMGKFTHFLLLLLYYC